MFASGFCSHVCDLHYRTGNLNNPRGSLFGEGRARHAKYSVHLLSAEGLLTPCQIPSHSSFDTISTISGCQSG